MAEGFLGVTDANSIFAGKRMVLLDVRVGVLFVGVIVIVDVVYC